MKSPLDKHLEAVCTIQKSLNFNAAHMHIIIKAALLPYLPW